MRLLIAASDFPPGRGGIQRYSHSLAHALQSHGHVVTVLSERRKGSYAADSGEPFSVARPRLSDTWALRHLANMATIIRLMRRGHNDGAIATNWYPGGFALCVASRLLRFEVLIICHGLDVLVWRENVVLESLMTWTLSRSHGLVAVSRFTKKALLEGGIPPDLIAVVHPGFPTTEAQVAQRSSDLPIVLSVSRLVKRKGIDVSIRALPSILQDLDILYVVVGDGPELRSLLDLADALSVRGRIRFLGEVADKELKSAYAGASLLVVPSRVTGKGREVEGFGIVLVEAQMMGVPVVATRTGGIPEAVLEGRTGLLVEAGQAEELACAVKSLLEDPAKVARMGRTAIKWVKRFDWNLVVPCILRQFSARGRNQQRE